MSKEKAAPAAEDSFDISALETADTAILEIRHPGTGMPSGWKWTIAGPGHPVTVEQGTRLSRKVLAEARLKEQAAVNGKKWRGDDRDPEEIRRENAETFAERVLGWTDIKLRGEVYPYSRENVVKLLLDPKMGTIYNQLIEFLRNDDSFLPGSGTN